MSRMLAIINVKWALIILLILLFAAMRFVNIEVVSVYKPIGNKYNIIYNRHGRYWRGEKKSVLFLMFFNAYNNYYECACMRAFYIADVTHANITWRKRVLVQDVFYRKGAARVLKIIIYCTENISRVAGVRRSLVAGGGAGGPAINIRTSARRRFSKEKQKYFVCPVSREWFVCLLGPPANRTQKVFVGFSLAFRAPRNRRPAVTRTRY